MKNKITVKILCYVFLGVIITGCYLYFQTNPAVLIRTEISPIDDETYKQLVLFDKKKFSDKSNFQEISFSLKINYPREIQNLEVQIPKYFIDLLGSDIYFGAKYKEYNDVKQSQFVHEAEIILYTGEVSKEQIKNKLNDGNVYLGWDYKGERVLQTYNIGDTVVYIK